MNMAIVRGFHEFNLQASIEHHWSSIYSGHCTSSIYCCKTFYCNDSKITEFEMNNTKNYSTAYVVLNKLIM